jgi:hypothetical protein
MDKGMLEEFTTLLQRQEVRDVDEVVMLAFGFAGAWRARRIRDR